MFKNILLRFIDLLASFYHYRVPIFVHFIDSAEVDVTITLKVLVTVILQFGKTCNINKDSSVI